MSTRHRIAVLGMGYAQSRGKAPPPQIAAIAGPDFAPELVECRYSAFPGTPYERGLATIGHIDIGIAAAKAGFDAVYINTFGDYGLAELRSALSIPVVGAGESSMALATTIGQRFAIVTIWPELLKFIYTERLTNSAVQDRCTEVVFVLSNEEMALRGGADDPVAGMRNGNAALIDRIVAACEGAIKRGADTIVFGCTCMAAIVHQVAARISAPVIDPLTTGYKMTETLLSLRLAQSGVAYPRAEAARISAIGDLVTGGMATATPFSDDCDVCVIAAE